MNPQGWIGVYCASMSASHDPLAQLTTRMKPLAGGRISLRDEANKCNWEVVVAPFELDPIPVTQALFAAVDPTHQHASKGPHRPVVDISWHAAIRFCNHLSIQFHLQPCYVHGDDPEGLDVVWSRRANGFRLPTEAEWELACRAGSTTPRYGELDEIAWYCGNSGEQLHDVAQLRANDWGFYDMIGNVWEWCWDIYDPRRYGAYRVFRGGGWLDEPRSCRASCRRKSHPTFRIDDLGFRLARTPDP